MKHLISHRALPSTRISQNLQHFRLFEIKPERAHGDFKLVIVDPAVLVHVKELERFSDLLHLVLGEPGGVVRTGAAARLFGGGGEGGHGEWWDGEQRKKWERTGRARWDALELVLAFVCRLLPSRVCCFFYGERGENFASPGWEDLAS
jgi:hypothetical protein